jgi:hypothetical protein
MATEEKNKKRKNCENSNIYVWKNQASIHKGIKEMMQCL